MDNYLIVGLGNIGFEYINTRHNIGFKVLDKWVTESDTSFISGRYANVAELKLRGNSLTLIKPTTYMNLSGRAVNYWLKEKKIKRENLLIVVDDIALPLGTLRLRKNGSAGGHNGLSHISETLGDNNYARLRVGIGDNFRLGGQVGYVLGEWDKDEERELPQILDRSIEAIKNFVVLGPDRAMNIANTIESTE